METIVSERNVCMYAFYLSKHGKEDYFATELVFSWKIDLTIFFRKLTRIGIKVMIDWIEADGNLQIFMFDNWSFGVFLRRQLSQVCPNSNRSWTIVNRDSNVSICRRWLIVKRNELINIQILEILASFMSGNRILG